MRLGFSTMGYLPYATLEEAIKRIARIGYETIDFWAFSPHLDPLHYDKQGRKAVRQLCDKAGVTPVALSVQGGGFGMQLNFSHSSEKVRQHTLEYYLSCVELARDIGCPMINWISGHRVFGTSLEQAWQWNREALEQIVEAAAKIDVTVAIHTLTPPESEVVVTLDDALMMMRQVGADNLKVMIDTADQNVTDPNISDAIRTAGKDLAYMHCNDNEGTLRGDVHLPPGQGNINWVNVFRTLKEIDYKGDVTAQVNVGFPVDMDAWAWETKEYLEDMMKKTGWR